MAHKALRIALVTALLAANPARATLCTVLRGDSVVTVQCNDGSRITGWGAGVGTDTTTDDALQLWNVQPAPKQAPAWGTPGDGGTDGWGGME